MFPGATVKEELHLIFRLIGKTAAQDDKIKVVSSDIMMNKYLSFVFQGHQQKRLGQVSAVMRNLGLTSFLNIDLKHSSTMCPGNT